MAIKNALKMVKDLLPDVKVRFSALVDQEVLVGVAAENASRKKDGSKKPPSNAYLAYIHDNGSPARNIPARPFMKPGIAAAKSDIIRAMKYGADAILDGDASAGSITLHKVGLIAQRNIRAVINAGIAPPLSDSTLKGRIRARRGAKGAMAELSSRKAGNVAGMGLSKPLIQTGQLRNSISYVVVDKRRGK